MVGPISRVRTRRTKIRQKLADKATVRRDVRGNPLVGIAIAVSLWAVSLLLLGWQVVFGRHTEPSLMLPMVGNAAFLLVSLFASGLFLEVAKPGLIRDNAMLLLMAASSTLSLASAKAMLYLLTPADLLPLRTVHALLPLAVAPLLATILLDGVAGMAAGIWTVLAIALLAGGSLPLFVTGMVATVVASWTAHGVRRRTVVARTGLIIGLSQTICVLALTALNWESQDLHAMAEQAAAALAGNLFWALFVLLVLPLFEAVFRVTTSITLRELSDLSHPLLQRLAIEAPGTYHHSLLVAILAQAAADEIGANGLLARVGAYFHDVGKLTKPDFFSENIQFRANPHDNLSPSMSTLVIISHVKEGLSLTVVHKLPDVVKRMLAEHHGTGLLSFFHHKAQSKVQEQAGAEVAAPGNGRSTVDESNFRYPGPKPSSRESAILCLADSVEAASRSVARPTPGHIEDLVNDIVNARLIDGQLDQSDLTLADLVQVKRSFVFTLSNIMHGRVPYPSSEDRAKQPQKAGSSERAGDEEADAIPDGSGPSPRPG